MWEYKKFLQYPTNVRRKDPDLASLIVTQFGGPDGELAASLRYLSQMYTMPIPEGKATLNSIGTEELAHFEIVGTIVYKLVEGVPADVLEETRFAPHYAQWGRANFPADAFGNPFTAAYFASHEDPIASITEDLAAEQKARAVYEYLLDLTDDPAIIDTLSFLRQREVVHFQRFGEVLDLLYDYEDNEGNC
ncbi:manganese catalase family protein [Iocasia frigidifontis]|uniref:Manganese catalase family protein n=1 Tax=Iocasia fonsfrigidae TaxID=2682810 RepID=A0A8A7KBY9_9FIRM|nr:manganese catalase family protein [Iocasia fonsfrigidae]QTL97088.1 manganese catalase family protein [Iocasia fonsfrigidae]